LLHSVGFMFKFVSNYVLMFINSNCSNMIEYSISKSVVQLDVKFGCNIPSNIRMHLD
jgi:hypothetical protein